MTSLEHKTGISRRTFAAGLAAAPVVLALAGRTPVARAADKVTINLNIYQINDNWHATLKKILEGFSQANPNIDVKLNIQPAAQYWDKLQTQYAAGQAPDISLINADQVVPGASRGMFVDLKPYFDKSPELLTDLWYPMEQDWGYKGGIYGGLLYAGGQMLYVNKDLLKAAGLEMPAATWNWDDLHSMAVKMTDASKKQYGMHFAPISPPYWSCAFIHGAGGTVLNDTNDKCTLNTPEARAGLQFIVDMIHKDKVMPIPPPANQTGQVNPFMAGKVGFYFGGSWDETAIRTSGFDWDWVDMPVNAKTGIKKVQMGSNAWGMLSSTDHKDEAWEVIKYLGGPEGAKGMMTLGLPGYKSIIDSPEFRAIHAPQHIEVPLTDFQKNSHNYYTTPDATQWWDAATQNLQPMWTGEDSVESSTQKATDAINKIFANRKS